MKNPFSSKDAEERRFFSEATVTAVLYGIAIGALAVGLAWKVVPNFRGSDTPPSQAQGTLAGARTSGGTSAPSPGDASSGSQPAQVSHDQRLTRCSSVYAAQQKPLHAAASAMAQWEVHIGAMNKLVLGVITLPQATQFWNQTRDGAHARLRAYAAADSRLNQLTIRCPTPGLQAVPGPLLRCERAVAANGQVLHLAHLALPTWRHHVRDMEMLRMGTMSPTMATQMWLQSWHAGQGQVTRYRAAVQATQGLGC